MKQGYEQAFLSLIEDHKGIIYKVVHAYSISRDDRQDLLQEILLSIWKAYTSFKGDSKISTWIYKVALYTAITNYRNEKDRFKIEQNIHDLYSNQNEEFANEPEEQIKLLYQAISKLSSVDKAIVLLLLEEKSYKEIAEIMGLKSTAIGMRVNRVKGKLEKVLTSIKS